MMELMGSVVAVAVLAAATGAAAQTAPGVASGMAMPSASDPSVRNQVMATLKAAPQDHQPSGNSQIAASPSPTNMSATPTLGAAAMRGTAVVHPKERKTPEQSVRLFLG